MSRRGLDHMAWGEVRGFILPQLKKSLSWGVESVPQELLATRLEANLSCKVVVEGEWTVRLWNLAELDCVKAHTKGWFHDCIV